MRTIPCPASGDLDFRVDHGSVPVRITASQATRTAVIKLTGPDKVIRAIEPTLSGRTWRLELPRELNGSGATVINSGGGRTVIGGMVITGDAISVGRAGRVIVDGVDVTSYVNEQRGGRGGGTEAASVTVELPAGSTVTSTGVSGGITTDGPLRAVSATTVSGDVEIGSAGGANARSTSGDITVEHLAGPGSFSSTSGDIEIDSAHAAVQANTMSGDIRVHAAASVHVMARSISGDVRITAAREARPLVQASSVSGRVRQP